MGIHLIILLIISITLVANITLAAGVLFFERKDIGYTWAWLMVLLFIPILGFIIYIFLGRNLKKKNFYKLSIQESAILRSAVDKQLTAFAKEDEGRSPLLNEYIDVVRMNLSSNNSLLTYHNQVDIFDDGHQKFQALFEDIRAAKKEINVQYYIIEPDALGEKLRDELIKKSKAGVKVRVLYDAIGSKKMSPTFFKELINCGGKVEVFFPSLLRMVNFRMNNRNHRKLCIIDGNIGYVGGFNVGTEYLGENKKFGYWRDTHLRIEGEAVNHMQARFILDWNQASKHKNLENEGFCFNSENPKETMPIQVVASGPNSENENLKNMYIKLIMDAKKSVDIQTPYFIPDSSFMDACKIALLSGVDIRIMIPNKPDHLFVHWASWVYVGELVKYGAKILLYDNGFLHVKAIIVDEKVASVGTMNVDSRSFRLNFEVNVILYDESIVRQLKGMFDRDEKVCEELTLERYQKRSLIIKFKEDISRLLSPIL